MAGVVSTPPTLKSVFDEIELVEVHLHSRERWFGKSADQSGNNWGTEAGLTPFQAISGNGDFGSDADDEAKVLGSADTPAITGMIQFDVHRFVFDDMSRVTPYVVRLVYGTGTMGEALAAGQYSDIVYKKESASGRGGPAVTQMVRAASGTKVWVQVKNVTDDATLDFFAGLHEYPE